MNQKNTPTKHTKIVCTIGPASASVGVLEDMIAAGMNVARINFSHADHDKNLALVEKVREASAAAGIPVAILQDLQGPKIRVGQLGDEGLELVEGNLVTVHAGVEETEHGDIPVPYDRLAHDLSAGDRILLDDGTKELEVKDVKGQKIRAKVVLGGRLLSHKGLNVPSATLSVESLTDKDDQDLAFGLQHNIDFVALSFVRSADDVSHVRDRITAHLPSGVESPAVIVKIEKHEALDHFDEILAETDGIMIARGDLGLETPASSVPIHQKELIAKCLVAGKPVITATHMLESMQQTPRPTRAEVSDVANAVIDHTDAVMLSGETAMGKFPIRAVETMAQIIHDTEESPLDHLLPDHDHVGTPIPVAVAGAAVHVARQVQAAAILVTTRSGYSARAVARFRPEVPVFAATDRIRTRQQLLLTWGVTPLDVDGYDKPEQMTEAALAMLADHGITSGPIVVVSGLRRESGGFDSAVRVVEK